MRTIIVLSFIVGYCCATIVQYTDCGSVDGKITQIDITPCSDPSDCGFQKGTTPSFTLQFTPNTKITTINATVYGIIQGLQVPFPLPNPNGCVNSGLSCPLSAGSAYTYKQSLPVLSSYPSTPLIVRWELVDQNSKDVTCFLVPAYVYG